FPSDPNVNPTGMRYIYSSPTGTSFYALEQIQYLLSFRPNHMPYSSEYGSVGNYHVTNKAWIDQYGRVEWAATFFISEYGRNPEGAHYIYAEPSNTSSRLYALENVQFFQNFRPNDLPVSGQYNYGSTSNFNFIITSKNWYDQFGRV